MVLLVSTLGLIGSAAGAEAIPPAQEFDLTTSATGACRLEGAGVNAAGGDSAAITLSGISRHELSFKG